MGRHAELLPLFCVSQCSLEQSCLLLLIHLHDEEGAVDSHLTCRYTGAIGHNDHLMEPVAHECCDDATPVQVMFQSCGCVPDIDAIASYRTAPGCRVDAFICRPTRAAFRPSKRIGHPRICKAGLEGRGSIPWHCSKFASFQFHISLCSVSTVSIHLCK